MGRLTEHCPLMINNFVRGSVAFCLKLKVNSLSHLLVGRNYPLHVIMMDIVPLSEVYLLYMMLYSWHEVSPYYNMALIETVY